MLTLRGERVEHAFALGAGGVDAGETSIPADGEQSLPLQAVEGDAFVLSGMTNHLPGAGDVVRVLAADDWVYPYTVVAAKRDGEHVRLRVAEGLGFTFDAAAKQPSVLLVPRPQAYWSRPRRLDAPNNIPLSGERASREPSGNVCSLLPKSSSVVSQRRAGASLPVFLAKASTAPKDRELTLLARLWFAFVEESKARELALCTCFWNRTIPSRSAITRCARDPPLRHQMIASVWSCILQVTVGFLALQGAAPGPGRRSAEHPLADQ